MTKHSTSLSLSELAISALDESNKSVIPNTLLEAIAVERTSINYIESGTDLPLDYKKLVELGLEALKVEADNQSNLKSFMAAMKKPEPSSEPKRISRNKAIELLIEECSTYSQLVELVDSEYGHQIDNVAPPTAPIIASNKYHYENLLVQRATNGKYSVSRSGAIV